jgi:hypothetical protein
MEYFPVFREYGITILDGANSFLQLAFCPFCGRKLPLSVRSSWFSELEQIGFDEPMEQELPDAYRSDAWWRGRISAETGDPHPYSKTG